jgi:hypothetical protein
MADAEKKEAPKRTPMITATRMRSAEYERQVWVANIEYGVSIEDIMVPGFWAHMANKLRPYDHIEARADDGTWIAHLIVTGCDRTWARVAVDRVTKLTPKDISDTQAVQQHRVEWKGPHNKFVVIRIADNEPVKTGFGTKEDAAMWQREHERMLGAPSA